MLDQEEVSGEYFVTLLVEIKWVSLRGRKGFVATHDLDL